MTLSNGGHGLLRSTQRPARAGPTPGSPQPDHPIRLIPEIADSMPVDAAAMTTLDDVCGLGEEVRGRALETEAGCSVPDDLIRKLGAAGVFRMFVPHVGGRPVDPMTACAMVEELSRADGSTGWTSMILNTTLFSCWLEPEVTRDMLATDPALGMAGLFAPIGRTEPAGDGAVRLSGPVPVQQWMPFTPPRSPSERRHGGARGTRDNPGHLAEPYPSTSGVSEHDRRSISPGCQFSPMPSVRRGITTRAARDQVRVLPTTWRALPCVAICVPRWTFENKRRKRSPTVRVRTVDHSVLRPVVGLSRAARRLGQKDIRTATASAVVATAVTPRRLTST